MYDHQSPDCGVTKALNIIGAKWTLLVIRDLLPGPRRFGELEHSLEGISPRTLAIRLKELEQDGVVSRDCPAGGGHPVYRLTEKGQSLQRILDQLSDWGATVEARQPADAF
jgi:DNA-binding HxlR family transcriptional regulator